MPSPRVPSKRAIFPHPLVSASSTPSMQEGEQTGGIGRSEAKRIGENESHKNVRRKWVTAPGLFRNRPSVRYTL